MWSSIWSVATLDLASELESDLQNTVDWGREWLVNFIAGKTQLVLFDWFNSNGAIHMEMDGSFLEEKYLLRCWGWCSLLNWIEAFTLSLLLKLSPRKLEPWFVRWSFFLLRVLCICINLLQPCMECCRHVWDGAHSFYWELLNKLQKWICSIVGPSLAASLEPLAHIWNVPSWSPFYMYYFGRCSSELVELVPLSYSLEWSTRYSDRLHDFFCHYSKIL